MWPFGPREEPIVATKAQIVEAIPDEVIFALAGKLPDVEDEHYKLYSDRWILNRLGKCQEFYAEDFGDCDDYARWAWGKMAFTGVPFGFIKLHHAHAMNFWISKEFVWTWYEPQTGKREYDKPVNSIQRLML